MKWIGVLLIMLLVAIAFYLWGQATASASTVVIERTGDWWGPWYGPWWRDGGYGAGGWPRWRRTGGGAWPGPWHPRRGWPGPRPAAHAGPLPIPGPGRA